MGNGVVFAQSEAETRDRIVGPWKLVSTEQNMDPMERAVVGQFAIGGRAILPAAGFQPALAA
jgi:hypothetical protein